MAKAKAKAKKKRKIRNFCGCPGVDARTGKVKTGYRASKRGGCPIKLPKAKRPRRKPIQYSTGSNYNKGYETYKSHQAKAAQWARSGYPSLSGLSADVRRRIELRRKKNWGRT